MPPENDGGAVMLSLFGAVLSLGLVVAASLGLVALPFPEKLICFMYCSHMARQVS